MYSYYTVIFNGCHHQMLYGPIPDPNDTLWCDRCKDYRTIKTITAAWRTWCQTCLTPRQSSNSRQGARRIARIHLGVWPTHVMYVLSPTGHRSQVRQDPTLFVSES